MRAPNVSEHEFRDKSAYDPVVSITETCVVRARHPRRFGPSRAGPGLARPRHPAFDRDGDACDRLKPCSAFNLNFSSTCFSEPHFRSTPRLITESVLYRGNRRFACNPRHFP